jgi:signal transduction histidine kinase
VGIPPEEQDRVFERFYRTASARRHQVHGSGLGLSIVKSVMDHHHGWIELESTPGVGTTVTLGLPLAGAGRAAPVPVSPAALTSGRRP